MSEPSAVVDEFARHLAACRVEFAGRPADELLHLWLVGLEREQIVSVAYRRDVIEHRLRRMPILPEVQKAVARAIRWAWRDEQMHALWIRGALLRRGTLRDQARAWRTQLEGAVAGWTSSRQHHFRWEESPSRRVVAELAELAGVATGRVPPAARAELHWQSFRDFCRFNVAAERTAAMAWTRTAELADAGAGGEPTDADAFRRMAADEARHARIFETFADAFDPDDRLAPHMTGDLLIERIAAVGQRFVSEPRPGAPAWANRLGKGGTVVVREAASSSGRADTLRAVLDAAGLAVAPGMRVAIKTTFMLAVDKADPSPAVSVPLLRALVDLLVERGCTVDVIDARNMYDRFHANRTVHLVAGYLGIEGATHRVVDAQDDQVDHDYVRGLGQRSISRAWRDADVRLLFGKLRSHPTGLVGGVLDVAEGLGDRHDAHVFTDRKVDRYSAILMLLDAFPPDVSLVDAFEHCPDGLLGMMGSKDARHPLRLYASPDAVALEAVLCRHVGVDPHDEHTLVCAAFDWFGEPDVAVDGPDTPIAGWRNPDHTARTALLQRMALPMFTHASRRGALFLPEMDEEAFPAKEPPGRLWALTRDVVRGLVESSPRGPGERVLLPTERVNVGGRPVRVGSVGAGPPVVLLHGYPDTLQIFSRLARLLPGRAIAFDWPGEGYSPAWDGPLDPAGRAEQLAVVLDALGLDKVRLVAHDMGAQPALAFAAAHPERVASIAVLNALLFADGPTSREIAVMRRSGLNHVAFTYAPGLVYRQCRRTFVADGVLPEALEADLVGAFQRATVRAHLSALCAAYEAALPVLPDRYWKIRAPLLALWGRQEAHFGVAHADRLAALVPGARRELIEGGHWMAYTHADGVAAALGRLFEEDGWTS